MTVKEQEHFGSVRFTLPKEERLSSVKIIEELFKKGSSCFLYPFKIIYLSSEDRTGQNYPQVLFSVSKKNFRKAVSRNKIKRRLREAYRKNKPFIFPEKHPSNPSYIAIVYVAKEILAFDVVEKKLISILERLKN